MDEFFNNGATWGKKPDNLRFAEGNSQLIDDAPIVVLISKFWGNNLSLRRFWKVSSSGTWGYGEIHGGRVQPE
jgi:hypothetical protein